MLVVMALLVVLALPATVAVGQPGPQTQPKLWIEDVVVTPQAPGPDTLCQLRVHLRNDGDQSASLLGFEVVLNGERLPTYTKDLFVTALPPGESTEVQLFNFWTTETGREAPVDGRWELEVRLTEAQWASRDVGGDGPKWRSLGPVADLPHGHVVAWGGAEPSNADDSGDGDG